MLANAAACYLAQNLPDDVETRLFILDDAGQFGHNFVHTSPETPTASISLVSIASRIPFDKGLPEKYRLLVGMANEWGADAYAVWEDDDIFLPWHISNIHKAMTAGVQFFRTPTVFSTYACPKGKVRRENAAGRFHSSWAFTREVYDRIGGYPQTNRLDFDQQLNRALLKADPLPSNGDLILTLDKLTPGYVYRWGNNSYHGSQAGEDGFRKLWESLEALSAPWVGVLQPAMDSQTAAIIDYLTRKPT